MATRETHRATTGWAGWIYFASVALIILGAFNVIDGLVALYRDNFYVTTNNGGLIFFNLWTWGWIHFGIGVVMVATGAFLFRGALWARLLATVLIVINAIAQLTFLAAFPLWAVIIIALDVVVLWAIAAHGNEVRAVRGGPDVRGREVRGPDVRE